MPLTAWTCLGALACLAACGDNLPDLAGMNGVFASADDDGVLCAANTDDDAFKLDSILDALDRARDTESIVELFMHRPGVTVSEHKLADILEAASDRGLQWVTNRELATALPSGRGIALSFDDWYVDEWAAERPLFERYHARVTFFVSDYNVMTDDDRVRLTELETEGHDVEYHSTHHWDAPAYVAKHGLDAYLANDIDPALAAMREDGFDPIVFAYPLGRRTPELDAALLRRFRAVRATTLHCPRR